MCHVNLLLWDETKCFPASYPFSRTCIRLVICRGGNATNARRRPAYPTCRDGGRMCLPERLGGFCGIFKSEKLLVSTLLYQFDWYLCASTKRKVQAIVRRHFWSRI